MPHVRSYVSILVVVFALATTGCVSAAESMADPQPDRITHIQGKALGPYSAVTRSGGMIFVSGQIGIDPVTGELGDLRQQTRQALMNLEQSLALAGVSTRSLVKVTVYLARAEDMAVMNEVYRAFFANQAYPARSTIPGADWGGRVLIEIDGIAVQGIQ